MTKAGPNKKAPSTVKVRASKKAQSPVSAEPDKKAPSRAKGCGKFLLYGFGLLILLSMVASICRGCAGPNRSETTRQSAVGQTPTAAATATPMPAPTRALTPPPMVKLPLLLKAESGWQFEISEVRTLKTVETDSERMRPKNGAFVVILGELRNFTDKDGCIHGSDFKLKTGNLELRLEDRVIGPVKKLLGGMDYPGSIMGQCMDYDASEPSFLVFDAPSDKPVSLVIDGSEVPVGVVAQLAEASVKPTSTPTRVPTATQLPTAELPTPEQQAARSHTAPIPLAETGAAPTSQTSPDDAITVAGWNIGLDDADIDTVAKRMAALDGVELWGIAEVNRSSAVDALEAAAEAGEMGDFASVLGPSGGGMQLVALYDDTRFDLLEWYELEEINTTGNARAPLVLHLRDTLSGERFLFMVNHLYRSRDDERQKQAKLLNEWAAGKALPVIAVGDYNFDWQVKGGDKAHDAGYDLMTEGGAWEWVRPETLVTTQCSGWPCRYDDVLDFVFTAGPAREWRAQSEIVVAPGDFPDTIETSDHRPVLATFWPDTAEPVLAAAPIDHAVQPTTASAPPTATQPPAPTATAVPPTPTMPPTATAVPPTAAPTSTPLPAGPLANKDANLRSGPGTDYSVVGGAELGQTLAVTGRSAGGDWLQLSDGTWIAAFLVDNAPAELAVVAAPALPTAPPPVVEERSNAAVPVVEPPTATPLPPPPSVVEQRAPSNCDPSYPTLCIPVGIGDLDCGDISARRFPVTGSDPHRFDGDHDGIGCESN